MIWYTVIRFNIQCLKYEVSTFTAVAEIIKMDDGGNEFSYLLNFLVNSRAAVAEEEVGFD